MAGAARIVTLGPAERFEWSYADVAPALSARALASAPAVVRVGAGAGGLVGIVGLHGAGADLRVVARDGEIATCDAAALAAYLRAPAEGEARAGIEATVARAGLDAARRPAVSDALLRASLAAERVAEGERLRPAQPSMWSALRAAGTGRRAAAAVAGYLAQLALVAGLWWTVGARAVAADHGGGFDCDHRGDHRGAGGRAAGRVVDGRPARHRRRQRAARAPAARPPGARHRVDARRRNRAAARAGGRDRGAGVAGAGRWPDRRRGAFELVTGAVILALGVAAVGQLPLLAACCAGGALLAARVQRALARWSSERVSLTHDLVERMVGERTLVAQQAASRRHVEQEAALARYGATGRALDRAVAVLAIVLPRGWLIVAIVALAPWLGDAAARPGAFATSLGGTLLVYGALRKLAQAYPSLGAAVIAWRQVAAMFAGAGCVRRRPPAGRGGGRLRLAPISARDVSFRYPGRAEPVLSGCALDIRRGDRVLLEGPSGGGKSTLAALLAGLRVPDAAGCCWTASISETLGLGAGAGAWARRRSSTRTTSSRDLRVQPADGPRLAAATPGRRRGRGGLPRAGPRPAAGAHAAGLLQLVGESGWQLSHGERSRLFIARRCCSPSMRLLDREIAAGVFARRQDRTPLRGGLAPRQIGRRQVRSLALASDRAERR